jgi:hypothetical protein
MEVAVEEKINNYLSIKEIHGNTEQGDGDENAHKLISHS